MAPWGPVMALLELGCCSWTFVGFVGPQSLGPCRQDDLRDDDFASPRGGLDKREHVPVGVALDHRRLPFAPRPSPRVSEESSRLCRALQICLRTIWSFFMLANSGRVALAPSAHCIGPYKHSPPIEVASPSDAHRLRPLSSSLHGPSPTT